jgi:hypothetical protein
MDTLPRLASADDLAERLGREFDDDELVRVEAVLDDASDLVREESRREWVSETDPTVVTAPRIVRMITLRCAERAIRNPEGFSSESAGDYSYQRNGATGEGGLYLTDRELKLLRRAGGRTGLWTQPVTRGEAWCRTEWANDQYGCEPLPIGIRYDDC